MKFALSFVLLAAAVNVSAQVPQGYWPEQKSGEILAKVDTIRLAPDLSLLTAGEQAALRDLLAVGTIFQDIYEESLHHQAISSRAALQQLHEKLGAPKRTQNLLDLYRLWK